MVDRLSSRPSCVLRLTCIRVGAEEKLADKAGAADYSHTVLPWHTHISLFVGCLLLYQVLSLCLSVSVSLSVTHTHTHDVKDFWLLLIRLLSVSALSDPYTFHWI